LTKDKNKLYYMLLK